MAKEEVGATGKYQKDENSEAKDVEVKVNYDFGDDLNDAINKFGEDAVFSGFKQQSKINLQALLRRHISKGDDQKTIQQKADEWKPGQVSVQRKSKAEKVQEQLESMSEEEKAEILKSLKG